MTLIKTTGKILQESSNLPKKEGEEFYDFITPLLDYIDLDSEYFLKSTNFRIYSSYLDRIQKRKITPGVLIDFINTNQYLIEIIKTGKSDPLLYKQPIVCLLYYLIFYESELTRELWPLTPDELIPLYTDLGKSSEV